MNLVALYGRLTKDPVLRYSQNGMANAFAIIAVDRGLNKEKRQEAEANGQPTADFIKVKAFGKTAEMLANYFKKGSKIVAEGKITTGSFMRDNERVFTSDIVITKVHFVDKKEG